MADALANAGSDVTVAQTSLGSQNFTGSGTPGTGGTTIVGYQWTLTGKPPGSTATLSNATTATVTLNPDIVGNYRLLLVVTDDAANVSEANPQLAPNAAFVQYRVTLTNSGLQKTAPGERDYISQTHALIEYVDQDLTDAVQPATTSSAGIVTLDESPVSAGTPKAVTQDRVSYSFTLLGKVAASPTSGNPAQSSAWVIVPEAMSLYAVGVAFGDGGVTTRDDYVLDVYRQTNSDFAANTFGVPVGTVTIEAPGTDNVPIATNITTTLTAFAARDVASVVISAADPDGADQGSDLNVSFHFKRLA